MQQKSIVHSAAIVRQIERETTTGKLAYAATVIRLLLCPTPIGAGIIDIEKVKDENFKRALIVLEEGAMLFDTATRLSKLRKVEEEHIDEANEEAVMKDELLDQIFGIVSRLNIDEVEIMTGEMERVLKKINDRRMVKNGVSKRIKPQYKGKKR